MLEARARQAQSEPLPLKTRSSRPRDLPDKSAWQLFRDLGASLRVPGFWAYGAWMDTVLRYRTHALGPVWMVSGTVVFVLVLGTLYSRVLGAEGQRYLPHLAAGIVVWGFLQHSLQGSARVFASNRNLIQNGYVHYADYILRLLLKNSIELAHNFLVVVAVLFFSGVTLTAAAWVLLLTVPLVFAAIMGACFLFAVVGARYADFQNALQSVLRVAIFVTPIIWGPHMLERGRGAFIGPFLYLNPFYYLVEVVRAPLVYGHVPWLEICVLAAAIPLIWAVAAHIYGRARAYIPLWV
ncbi:MAG TPA: ABC transporter permease [Methyloceanibacter sp.]|nr:ABC transporter permease [Methyloceanibacter sp.]